MARSIIHRLVRPGILLVIINLEWNKTSSADSPEDFITGIKTFGLTWISWTSAFRVPIPLVFGTSLTVHGHYTQGYGRDSESTTGIARCIAYTASSMYILKIAPGLEESQLTEIAEVIRNSDIDGIIAGNLYHHHLSIYLTLSHR